MTGHHPDDAGLAVECMRLAHALAERFDFDLRVVEHKRRPHPGGASGLCYQHEGRIAIVIRHREGSRWSTRPESRADVIDTVCHEVAHLPRLDGTPGLKDGPAHRELQRTITEWAQQRGMI